MDTEAAGYVLPENFEVEQEKAETRMREWRRGDWRYIGVRATAEIQIPCGNGSFALYTLTSPGLWGVESDAGESYLNEVFEEEKAELISALKTLGARVQTL